MKPRNSEGMAPRRLAGLSALLAGAVVPRTASGVALRAAQSADPGALAVPDSTPFNPMAILCNKKSAGTSGFSSEADSLFRATFGSDSEVSEKVWCEQWLQCIKDKSMMTQDKDGVLQAWAPADCKEVCGEYPATTPREGQAGGGLPAKFMQVGDKLSTAAHLFSLSRNSTKFDCVESCGRFQKELSTCVAAILYEPGQVTVMGAPGQKATGPEPPKWCSDKGTPCVAELASTYQQCLVEKTNFVVKGAEVPGDLKKKCADMADDMEHCKGCPQMDEAFASQYYAFTGGCMQQLHAYWQATHPGAKTAALPGATPDGCKVHR